MLLPINPMAPLNKEHIPIGDDWGYQIKWDGVRIIARIHDGTVTLYSRSGLIKNAIYPEIVAYLSAIRGRMIIDGEAIVFDAGKQRPSFQLILQRERMKKSARIAGAARASAVTLVLFDLIELEDKDLRRLPFSDRYKQLTAAFPDKSERLFVTDLFYDGDALWKWIEQNGWEGMVSKRLSSAYREGKRHMDWFKKKTIRQFEVDIVGITLKEGNLSSLVMMSDELYFGRVSLGLNELLKQRILLLAQSAESPFSLLTADLRNTQVLWLAEPFAASVSGLEVTDYGLLRHPKIVALKLP